MKQLFMTGGRFRFTNLNKTGPVRTGWRNIVSGSTKTVEQALGNYPNHMGRKLEKLVIQTNIQLGFQMI